MKKQSGFTLIELVIVIIILGILAATAVPKFVDLQSDARESAMKGLKGALEGAATLTYSRSAIDGNQNEPTSTANGVATVYGYPAATSAALTTAAGLSANDWTIDTTTTTDTAIITAEGANASAATATTGCNVSYKQAADSASRPTITVSDQGC